MSIYFARLHYYFFFFVDVTYETDCSLIILSAKIDNYCWLLKPSQSQINYCYTLYILQEVLHYVCISLFLLRS